MILLSLTSYILVILTPVLSRIQESRCDKVSSFFDLNTVSYPSLRLNLLCSFHSITDRIDEKIRHNTHPSHISDHPPPSSLNDIPQYFLSFIILCSTLVIYHHPQRPSGPDASQSYALTDGVKSGASCKAFRRPLKCYPHDHGHDPIKYPIPQGGGCGPLVLLSS